MSGELHCGQARAHKQALSVMLSKGPLDAALKSSLHDVKWTEREQDMVWFIQTGGKHT